MNDERWTTVDRLLGAALERAPHERAAFLREACAGDEPLRQDVESLLTHASRGAGFLSTPAFAGEAAGDVASFVGRQLGRYSIQAPLGAGGMGEVYRARDGTLGRDVAIKILPRVFSTNPDRRARFDREARLLAALNHPHIAAIYGVEDSDGVRALVLELVEGDTLADRLARGALAVSEALRIARQIADALEAAHEKGIVHRDLKPANIKITPEGVVKVLDFGLAKAAGGDSSGPDLTQSPAVPNGSTRHGLIFGTASYMSPEQARGRPVDTRTDIWAFGCVLYEMLTGTQAFPGGDLSEILAGIIKSEPNWDAVPADVPPVLGVWLRRCLHKDSRQRLRDIGDLRLALDGAFDTPSHIPDASVVAVPSRSLLQRWPQLVIVAWTILVALTSFAVWSLTRSASPVAPVHVYAIALPQTSQLSPFNVAQLLDIAPNGQRYFFIARHGNVSQLYSRKTNELTWTQIGGAEGAIGSLFVKPDGNMVGFIDVSDVTIKKLPLNGDLPVDICRSCGAGAFRGASWGANGSIVFATTAASGLMQVQETGGVPAPLTSPPPGEVHLQPHFLPDGNALLLTVRPPEGPDHIAYLSLDTHRLTVLFEGSSPRFATSGHLVFVRGTTLWAVPFDSKSLRLGVEQQLSKDVAVSGGSAWFAMSREGTLVYIPAPAGEQTDRTLVWVYRGGREIPITAPPRPYGWPRLSHDGTRVAVELAGDISTWEFANPGLKVFTQERVLERSPAWMPNDKGLVFASFHDGPSPNLFWRALDGGPVNRLTSTSTQKEPYSVSLDGTLVFGEQVQRFDLMSLTLDGEPNPQPLLQTASGERDADISPDGRWVAYSSGNELGLFDIYVRPFHQGNADTVLQISTTGGRGAVWALGKTGLELFYQAPAGKIMAVRFDTHSGSMLGKPSEVLDATPYVPTVLGRMYDVSRDGERFLMLKPNGRPEQAVGPASLVVVLNWFEDLKARAPGK